MRGIVVASSPYDVFEQIYKPIPGDLIVGVDGGCKAIKKYPIDIAFGDFDSLQGPVEAKKVFHYPRQKKETDLELAIDALKNDVDEFIIYNATGGRLDHFMANLRLLERYHNIKITLKDDLNEISLLKDGTYYLKKDDKYKYFSLIPCVDSIVTIENALYKLSSGIVKRTDTYTVSNQILEEDVKITIHEGRMFLIKASDK